MATSVRFRSRHQRYRYRSLQFENHVAETDDQDLIEAAENDPHFGSAFWRESKARIDAAAARANGNAGSDTVAPRTHNAPHSDLPPMREQLEETAKSVGAALEDARKRAAVAAEESSEADRLLAEKPDVKRRQSRASKSQENLAAVRQEIAKLEDELRSAQQQLSDLPARSQEAVGRQG